MPTELHRQQRGQSALPLPLPQLWMGAMGMCWSWNGAHVDGMMLLRNLVLNSMKWPLSHLTGELDGGLVHQGLAVSHGHCPGGRSFCHGVPLSLGILPMSHWEQPIGAFLLLSFGMSLPQMREWKAAILGPWMAQPFVEAYCEHLLPATFTFGRLPIFYRLSCRFSG